MFLDDELLKICEEIKISTPESIQLLNRILCNKCEIYYKSKIKPNMLGKEIKVILDRTFNLFDSFVRMALKSDNVQVKILAEAFKKHTFKKQFLSNEKMKEIYNKLH